MELTKKHISIIESLFSQDVPEERLAFNLNISVRTLGNYCLQIQTYFGQIVSIDKRFGSYCLTIVDSNQFKTKYQKLVESIELDAQTLLRRKGQVFQYLLCHEISNIDDIADELFLSKASTVKVIQSLKSELGPFQVDINGITNVGILLHGEEYQIRKAVIEIFPEIIANHSISEEVMHCIKEVEKKYHLESTTIENLLNAIKVTEMRMASGHFITNALQVDPFVYHSDYFNDFREVLNIWKSTFEKEDLIQELMLVVLQLIGRRATIMDQLNKTKQNEVIDIIIQETIKDINYFYQIKIDDALFSHDIKLHLIQMINRLIFKIELKDNTIQNIQFKYPFAYELSKVLADQIKKQTEVDVPENELSFIALYFSVYLEEIDRALKSIEKVAVITDQGLSTTKLITSYLKNIFTTNTQIDVFPQDALTKSLVDQYKLVVSSVQVHQMFNKVVYIDDILDQALLKSKIEQFLIYKDVNNKKYNNHSTILSHLSPDDFYLVESDNYETVINTLCDELINEGHVNETFKSKLISKENERSTINGAIGFPHTDYDGNALLVKIALIPSSIKCGQNLKMVILIGIPNQNVNEAVLIRIYEEILYISSNDYFINKLDGVKHYVDFVKLVNQEMRL
ncbi:PRD domain-containing protein [Macrococcus sp. DPC7161]|uniref:BglG family transcription antiterminator n=1 Tax=Macrococcus sp. DPC7161 TaxID=2507060 RepID=UPI00100B8B43|nr:PRD domain-containing protein [Macrococcus sp. DPC7161]RXK17374.1 PRD domain-containing protein [Macrococcus sp. DPC7161]